MYVYSSTDIDIGHTKRTTQFQQINPNFIVKRHNTYIRFRDYRVGFNLFPTLLRDSKKIDIFHSHAIRSFQEDVGVIVAKIRNKPFVITTHGNLNVNLSYSDFFPKLVHDCIVGNLAKKFLNLHFIAVSKLEIQFIKNFGIDASRITYIPHGVNTDFFQNVDASDLRERLRYW